MTTSSSSEPSALCNLSPQFISRLKELAEQKTLQERDVLSVYDVSGGNVDDAYEAGVEDGETFLAREVLEDLGIKWENNDES